MRKKIYGLTKDDLPRRFRRFFIPGDVILLSRERANPPPDIDKTPSSSANSNASPSNDDTNTSSSPQISCFYCLLDKFLCCVVFVVSGFTFLLLNYLLDKKHTDLLAWSSFSSLSSFISTISSTPKWTLLTFLILPLSFSLQITSLFLLLTHKFESTPQWQQASHVHTRHLINRLLIPVLPLRHRQFLSVWLINLEILQEMYSNLYGSNHQNNINRYTRQDPTKRFYPMDEFHHLLFHHSRWIVVRLSPYPLSPRQERYLRYIPSSALRERLKNLHQTYHYWQLTQAADGAFAVLDGELESYDPEDYPTTLLEAWRKIWVRVLSETDKRILGGELGCQASGVLFVDLRGGQIFFSVIFLFTPWSVRRGRGNGREREGGMDICVPWAGRHVHSFRVVPGQTDMVYISPKGVSWGIVPKLVASEFVAINFVVFGWMFGLDW